jgi:ABC-2 type transport system permease protein
MKAQLAVCRAFLARDLRLATSYRLEFLLSVARLVFPLLVLYLPAQLIGDLESARAYGGFLPFSVVGVGMMNFFMACYGSVASAVRSEQGMGTLESVLMTPVSLPTLVFASSLWAFGWAALSALIFIGGGALLYDIPLRGSLWLSASFVLLTALVFAGMGVLSASFVMVFKRGDPIGPALSVMFFLLGGIIYPVEVLPSWLRPAAEILPITHAAAALRDVILLGEPWSVVAGHFTVLLGYALLLIPLGLWAFHNAVRQAKRDGTLLQY